MKWRQKQCGLSIMGLVIVMIVVGALAAALLPMLLSKNNQSMRGEERQALEAAKTAIIGYALSKGKLPGPVDVSGNIVPTGKACDASGNAVGSTACLMPPSAGTGTGVIPTLGVNNWGVYGSSSSNQFRMDVNDAFASLGAASSVKDLCSVAQKQLAASTSSTAPGVCQDTSSLTTASCSSTAPVAFVLYSTGSDRKPNLKNAGTNRIYESDNRGIDNTAGATYYDDQVVSYPLSGLVNDCATMQGLPVCNLNATPTTIVSGGPNLCSATLTASCSNGPKSYTWTNSGFASNITTGAVFPATTTTYTVSGTNEIGAGPVTSPATKVTVVAASCTVSSQTVPQGKTATFTANCTNSYLSPSYVWSVTPSGACTFTSTGATASFATSSSNCDDVGSPYTVTVTATGSCGSPATNSPAAILTVTDLTAPVASNVTITGTAQVGQTLTGSYTYSSPDSDPEGVSMCRWLSSNTAVPVLVPSGPCASTKSYTVASTDLGYTITFEVTPISTVPTTGAPVQSSATVTVTTSSCSSFCNGSFETNNVPANSYLYISAEGMGLPSPVTATGWTFNNYAGVTYTGSWVGEPATTIESNYSAFLQTYNGSSAPTISQTFTAAAGTYAISFAMVPWSASSSPQSVNVMLDGVTLNGAPLIPPSGTTWTTYNYNVTEATSGTHTLSFSGLAGGGNFTAFLDNVSVNAETNFALASNGGTASASSSTCSYPASLINDGDLYSSWWCTYTVPATATITFNNTKTIDHVVLYAVEDSWPTLSASIPTTCTKYVESSYTLKGLLPSGAWDVPGQVVTLGQVTGNSLCINTTSFAPIALDAIRVSGLYNVPPDGNAHIAELQAWGVPPLPAGYISKGGLVWMPVTFVKTWGEANTYCTTQTINGQTGWRLPTQTELSALDASGAMSGQGWTLGITWSSTSGGGAYYDYVDLSNANAPGATWEAYANYVTCVR